MRVQNGLSVACASNESTWKRRPDWVPILALRLGGDHTVGESQEFFKGQPTRQQTACVYNLGVLECVHGARPCH